MNKNFSVNKLSIKKFTKNLLLATIGTILTTIPVHAADKIFFTYRSLKFTLKVESLEKYAKTGVVEKDLAFYLQFVSEKEREEFKTALTKPIEIDPVLLSRLLNTNMGEDLLRRLGTIMGIPWNINGNYAIRGALVQSAFTPEGLTLLGFFQKYPTDLQLDVYRSLAVAQRAEKAIFASEQMVKEMDRLVTQEVGKLQSPDFSKLPDITANGSYEVEQKIITLTDQKRNRTFDLFIYQPKNLPSGKIPVVVMSHGLASRPQDYDNGAKHLASYGYVVALPQHIGSDIVQAENLLKGYTRVVFQVNEFIDRPLDLSFTIDYLETQNQSVYQNRLNLKEVGVAGHSFGGYTALAVAGATIDFKYLESECKLGGDRFNMSLLLQCVALKLPREDYNFRDERVTSAFVVNPVNRSIFGKEGLSKVKIPVLMIGGSYDPAAPPIYEQFRSFPWLGSENKYLALAEGQAHVNFSKLDPGIQSSIESIASLPFPSSQVLARYGNGLLTSFFGTYTEKNETYLPFIQNLPAYSEFLSVNQEFKLFVVTSKSASEIDKALTNLSINE